MPRCKTPDVLIGIGGGGSKVVYRYMQQEWLLEELFETDDYAQNSPGKLQATTIDTAQDDDWQSERAEEAKNTIDNILPEDYDSDRRYLELNGYPNDDSAEPIIVPEKVGAAYAGQNLTSPAEIRKLQQRTGLSSWWLEDNKAPISNFDAEGAFSGGVLRNRSVSKALYHVAEGTDNSVVPDHNPDDYVAVVAALGGGTGSGMILDLAEELTAQTKHLYAIIPNENAGKNELANAHAALSELEYLQLTDELPFATVTLMPHHSELDTEDEKFEQAVVRTINAHQNAYQGGNFPNQMRPAGGSANTPPKYSTFSVAVPQTVTYDISKRNTAKNEVEDILTNKEDALTKEKAFYDVLEQYLESFPSVEETDNLKREDKEEAEQLRNRFETDFVETFIDSPVLALAGFDDATTKIYEIFESLQADLSQRNTENVDNYLQTVPTRFENEVTKEEIPKQGTHPDDISLLLDILELECENITTRWHLWKRISNISQETTDPPLDATVARDIRRALRDVVLDSEQSYLDAVVVDQTIEERYENKDDEYAEKQEACEEAETAYDEVAGDLEELIADWRDRDEVRDAADELAAITKYEDTVNSAINDLATYLSTKANAVESDDPQEVQNTTLQLSTVGPLDDFEGRGLRNLNEKLDDMGVAQIDRNQLEAEFAIVKDARELHLEHGGWLTDNTEDFSDELVNLHEGDHRFEIMGSEPNPGIDVNFECSFRDSMIERDIQKQQKELTEELAQTFSAALSNEELVPEKSSTAKIPAKEYDWEQVVEDELKGLIDGSEFEDAGELLGALLDEAERDGDADPFAIPQSEVETDSEIITKLFEAYLQPLGETVGNLKEDLYKLKNDDDVGTIDRLKRLKGIAEGPGAVAGGVELPQPDPEITDEDEVTGSDIASLENPYDIELESNSSGDEETNPYRKQRNVSPEDLAEDAEHVGDTDVWENNKDKILGDFAVAVGNLDDERVPLNEPEPTSRGEEVSRFYEGMRFRSVYLSPQFDRDASISGARFEEVFEGLPLNNKNQAGNLYSAETYDSGHPDEFTMVLFIGGIILDNLAPATKMNGYKDTFDTRYNEQEFPGAFQTIGLGARWDTWKVLGQWAEQEAADQEIEDAYGAYVYRDEIRRMDEDFVSEIMQRDANEDATTADILLDMYDIDLYESTVQPE